MSAIEWTDALANASSGTIPVGGPAVLQAPRPVAEPWIGGLDMAEGTRQLGADNPNWKGGCTVASNGYVLVKARWHPAADSRGYVYEHRLVAERLLGRPLREGEQVHHLNHVKTDNRPENLRVMASQQHHAAEHRVRTDLRRPGEPNPTIACLCGCGTSFPRFDSAGRPRSYVSGHNVTRNPATGRYEAVGS